MKIAILGTKGIPNNYGGFEQFAEYLSVMLVERGHSVTVYNPSFHKYRNDEYKGVRIKRIFSPEKLLGGAANFIYDHICLVHALKQDYDIIYEAGYHSVALSYRLLNIRNVKSKVIITNMDGLEWKRSKWSPWIQRLIRKLEFIAVRHSPYLISDNEGIRRYYLDTFNRDSYFIPYGADPVHSFDSTLLHKYQVERRSYYLLVARMEPENNIEMILQAHKDQNHNIPFLVIGNYSNKFGKEMEKRFSSSVRFVGAIYEKKDLDCLRYYAKAYFHGHSVGGTNPSLLEAMACQCFIVAHENQFNRAVLGDDALYFSSIENLSELLKGLDNTLMEKRSTYFSNNLRKIENSYSWEKIMLDHETLFASLLEAHSSFVA